MRALAEKLGFDQDVWGIAGLLHDLDYSETKDDMKRHGLLTEEILKEKGVSKEITDAIKSHNADNLGFERKEIFVTFYHLCGMHHRDDRCHHSGLSG